MTGAGVAPGRRRILFLEKVFLRPRKGLPLRGVELFNLYLIRDLVRAGHEVTLVAGRSWQEGVEATLGAECPSYAWVPDRGPDFVTALRAVWPYRENAFDNLLVGNVGHSLLPALAWLRRRHAVNRPVVIAHREASPRFVAAWKKWDGTVVAVNRQIAQPFQDASFSSVAVDYGIMNAEAFFPRTTPRPEHKPVDFCLLGALENAWKGADTAVAAFRALSQKLQARARLHLVAYHQPPNFGHDRILAHAWTGPDRIPGLLREMDVLLVPSRDEEVMRETFSQAIVQGMLTGLPVIAHDLPILAEKLDHGGGVLFRTETELTQAMAELITQAERREAMGAQGRAVALERYVWSTERFVERYLS